MDHAVIKDIICSNYGLNNIEIVDAPQGASNITKFAVVGNDRYVLRVYKHGNIEKVICEHEVVSNFKKRIADIAVPEFQLTKSGQTFILTNELLMAMYPYIPGQLFKRGQISEFGRAIGRTVTAFKNMKINAPSPKNPYDELLHISPEYLPSLFGNLQASPFNFSKDDAKTCIDNIECQIGLAEQYSKLPVQWIHGDLTRQNVLFNTETNRVSGLIDFELASEYYKTMEIATSLVSMLRMKSPEEEDMFVRIKELTDGYKLYEKLSAIEVELLPS